MAREKMIAASAPGQLMDIGPWAERLDGVLDNVPRFVHEHPVAPNCLLVTRKGYIRLQVAYWEKYGRLMRTSPFTVKVNEFYGLPIHIVDDDELIAALVREEDLG